ncbi:MAG: ISAs1 family transposase [Spirochaetaceae bacterium]|nr:ISAs1 family transposase [Spirochaetaceae bacterium]
MAEDGDRNLPVDVWLNGIEKRHGRQESREVLTEEDTGRLNGKEKGKDIKTILLYQRNGTENGKPTAARHYYISSRALDAEQAAQLICGRRSIENGLRWFLDECFGEDSRRARTNRAAENLNS